MHIFQIVRFKSNFFRYFVKLKNLATVSLTFQIKN